MGKFKNKLIGFLYGRYGNDTLNKVLTAIYLIWLIVFTVVDVLVKSIIFSIIALLFIIWCFVWFLVVKKRIKEKAQYYKDELARQSREYVLKHKR